MSRCGTRDGGGWLRENLIRGQVGNSSVRRRIHPAVYKTEPAVRGHHKALSAAALDLDGEETEPTAVSPTAAPGRCWPGVPRYLPAL